MAAPDVGVVLPSMTPRDSVPGDVAATGRHAEDLGYESVWVVDQLVAGTGVPLLDSPIALAAAAATTTQVKLGFGVMILPLRPVVWVAKQVGSLQHMSGGRVILGVGAGGDRHEQAWLAAGVPRRERGRRMDAALRVLPSLLAGEPTRLQERPDSPPIQLAPAVAVPPVLVGGMSEPAMRRAVDHAEGWFLLPVAPAVVAAGKKRLSELAAAKGRPTPSITVGMMTALSGDPDLPAPDALTDRLTDPDGMFGMPADQVPSVLTTGGRDEAAARLAALAEAGADRVVVTIAAGGWPRQAELLAEARALLS